MQVSQAAEQIKRLHHKLGSSPLILFFLGGASLLLWACATTVQIQTSEYLALRTSGQIAGVQWGIIQQLWWLITGAAPVSQSTGWIYGWVVELITLVFALALSAALTKLREANPHIPSLFVIGGLLLMALNSWADYSASPGSNGIVRFLIALAIGGMAVVGLPLGIGLLEHGFEEFK
jgi:hypothetical protein